MVTLTRQSLISEVENAIGSRSNDLRVQMLRRVTDLFLGSAPALSEDLVGVFDEVIGRLSSVLEKAALAELSGRLAPVPNAPIMVVKSLANDDRAEVAAPVLSQSRRLDDRDLVRIAGNKSQRHLLAISARPSLSETVTDVLVSRGDSTVVRSVAANEGARISERGFDTIVAKSRYDDALVESVGLRADIPPHQLQHLLATATSAAREKLAAAMPGAEREIVQILAKLAGDMQQEHPRPDYAAAQSLVESIHREGKLGEAEIEAFARAGKFAETAVALSVLSGVGLGAIERAMREAQPDMLFIVAKATGLHWPTAKSIYQLQTAWQKISAADLENARKSFLQLQAASAQRIVSFIKVRHTIAIGAA